MTVKQWLIKTFRVENSYGILIRNRAVCEDGFSISIQASRCHYCTPRLTISSCEYESLELGYPSKYEPLLKEYKEGNIFPYVPIEVVEKVIEKHGEIVWRD